MSWFTVKYDEDGKPVIVPVELTPHPMFDALNAWAFGGKLERVPVSVTDEPRDYSDPTTIWSGIYSRMQGIILREDAGIETLLHEMVHVALDQCGPWENEHHGPGFVAECQRIGALIYPWFVEEYAELFGDDYSVWPSLVEFSIDDEEIEHLMVST
jgi:hypothetical protein